ncbi:MAG: futalosine hydrolase [Chitinophagales bacterium]|nr:futalosine hydrolase [Chitinophagales bacterium]MDW8394504.1 futalosine hydrolase [Chitinophagales bacterium]
MKVCIIAATQTEVSPLLNHLNSNNPPAWSKQVSVHISGVGPTATAYTVMRLLQQSPELMVQAGICGAFHRQLKAGSVVQVIAERYGDWGAEDGRRFLDVFDLQLADPDGFPFRGGWMYNPYSADVLLQRLPQVRGLTVSRTSGKKSTISLLKKKYNADVESMEGAAFFYCCLREGIPFLSLRAVSNRVRRRQRHKWKTERAIRELNAFLVNWLDRLFEFESPISAK